MNEENKYGIDIGGFHVHPAGPWQFQVAVLVLVVIAFAWSIVWILRDSESRGKSGCLALLFLLVAGWPLSILWWLWLRPSIVKFKFKEPATPPEIP